MKVLAPLLPSHCAPIPGRGLQSSLPKTNRRKPVSKRKEKGRDRKESEGKRKEKEKEREGGRNNEGVGKRGNHQILDKLLRRRLLIHEKVV